jgi:hypothetical protein
MSRSTETAIREIQRTPGGWIHVEAIRKTRAGVVLSLDVRKGKRGATIGGWEVTCDGIRELNLSDLDGGGIRLYRSSHPSAKQYVAPMARLRCRQAGNVVSVLGALAQAHLAAVDDWIPLDRYLPMDSHAKTSFVVAGPDFLVRAYARALRRLDLVVSVKAVARRRRATPAPSVLHFGNSFIVANGFEVARRSMGLENNEMHLTRSATARRRSPRK